MMPKTKQITPISIPNVYCYDCFRPTVCLARSSESNGLFLWTQWSHGGILERQAGFVNRVVSARTSLAASSSGWLRAGGEVES